MIPGQQAPNFRNEVPAIFDDAGDEVLPVPQEVVYDDAQDEVLPIQDTQVAQTGGGGISGLPLPLLLEAARFGADIAERGTRGENFLGSIAGAGKTSIDRGLKFAERQMRQQQLQDIANVKRRQGLEDFVLKEQIKDALETPESASVSELNTAINSLNDQLLNPELDELEKDRIRAQIADLRRMMQSRVGLAQGPTQNLSPEAQAIIDQRTQPAS